MSDAYTRRILTVYIADLAQKAGYSSLSQQSIEILVHVLINRIKEIAIKTSKVTNSFAKRFDSNGYDLFYALSFFNETPQSLSRFINSLPAQPRFPHLVSEYPTKRISNFYSLQNRHKEIHYFRCSIPIPSKSGFPSVPEFYPSFPEFQEDEITPQKRFTPRQIYNAPADVESDEAHTINIFKAAMSISKFSEWDPEQGIFIPEKILCK